MRSKLWYIILTFCLFALFISYFGRLFSLDCSATAVASASQKPSPVSNSGEARVRVDADWDRFGWMTAEDVKPFYEKYAQELNHLRDEGDDMCSRGHILRCVSTFIEMELLYMRLRELKPRVVIEACPFRGWSTFWILNALKANGFGNHHSFDKMRKPLQLEAIIADAPNVNWTHHQGFMQNTFPSSLSEEELETVDYIFMDMSHNKALTEYYTEEIFGFFVKQKPVTKQERVILVSVHDVYNEGILPLCRENPDHSHPTIEGLINIQWILSNLNFVRNGFDWNKHKNNGSNIKSLLDARQSTTGYECGVNSSDEMRYKCDVLTLYWSLHIPGLE